MKEIKYFREWQIEAIQLLRPAQYALCQAPGGSGKSLVQVALAQADIDDTGNRQLILVPQNHIHHSFFAHDRLEFTLPGNDRASCWSVAQNLCEKRQKTVHQLRAFLLEDVRTLRQQNRLTAISTHPAMVAAWKSFSAEEKKRALQHISFRIDEAHHISNVFHEDDLSLFNQKDRQRILEDGTQLGNVVRHLLRANCPTVKLHLTTATFFRGDKKTIISKALRQQFAHYYLPWDVYYSGLGIEDLRFTFLTYDDDPVDAVVEAVRKEPNEHHLIIIPSLTRRYRTATVHGRLVADLRKELPAEQVLDLVTPHTQEQNKAQLFKSPDRYRVVVACRLFDEGTDWVRCNRLHNTDAGEASLTLAVQRFFRPLRKHPQKKQVIIRNYLPRFSTELELGEQRAILSDRLNAVLACIVTQGELVPTLVLVKGEGKNKSPRKAPLQELYGDEYPLVVEDLLRGYEAVENKTDSVAIGRVVDKIMKDYPQPADTVEPKQLRHALLVQIARIAAPKNRESNRRSLAQDALDAETIRRRGFDKVWEKLSPLKSALCWGTENITTATIRELLGVLDQIPTLDDIKAAIKAFFDRTGRRPTYSGAEWLQELGRSTKSVDHVATWHYGLTLAELTVQVLGEPNEGLLDRTRELIREYWTRGVRLNRRQGMIPEMGMTGGALNARLERNFNTTIAQEVNDLLGPATDPFTLEKARLVIRNYLKKKVRLHPSYGPVPELSMTAAQLDEKLQDNFEVTLDELVDDVKAKMIYNGYPPNLSLPQIHQGIRAFYQVTGQRPRLNTEGTICGKKIKRVNAICRMYHATTLPQEVTKVLGDQNDGWLDRVHAVIRQYWQRGVRITSKSSHIPELGMKGASLNWRLSQHYESNIAQEFEKVTGIGSRKITLDRLKEVIKQYLSTTGKFGCANGHIPELEITKQNLAIYCKRNLQRDLSDVVEEVSRELKA